ncbi:uncharacterized protein LOC112569035 [Pomacea canaliculata]|uniref:uncharacterized protein LOC112569035 n=1 Tax=Pomacea canaliculata TaxID=400727 RepID=UPI000D72B83B|nr:uncharacterized protein LOC112569035 [Pomacea canaliculata]
MPTSVSAPRSTTTSRRNAAMASPSEHSIVVEECKLKTSCTPSKGGIFLLAMGAKVEMPEGVTSKKEVVECLVVPPSQRWQYELSFPEEYVTSEIFVLSGNVRCKDKKILFHLPYYPPTDRMREINVKVRWSGEANWVDINFPRKQKDEAPVVELELDRLGTFVVTQRHRREEFSVTPYGCLYNPRIARHLSLRFPKKALDTTVNYAIRVYPIPEERVQFVKDKFPLECADIQKVTEIIDITPDKECEFRRPATIKLPLPEGVEVEEEDSNDVFVLRKVKNLWENVGNIHKFTRYTVAVEVKNPSRFCVVKSKPERDRKMKEALAVVEEHLEREKGEVSVFLSIKEKSWMVVVGVFPLAQAADKITGPSAARMSGDPPAGDACPWEQPPRSPMGCLEIWDGLRWEIELNGDLQCDVTSDLLQNKELQYFKYLPDSYRSFLIQPVGEELRSLSGVLTLTPIGVDEVGMKAALTFTIYINEEAVRAYFYKEPEPVPAPEPQLRKAKVLLSQSTSLSSEHQTALLPGLTKSTESTVERLSRSSRHPRAEAHRKHTAAPKESSRRHSDPDSVRCRLYQNRTSASKINLIVDRESKVLSGRSLMTLSRVVPEGLTLAVYLDVPDTVITGIGFDALAQGSRMCDITYKILVRWKRECKDKRDGAVQTLVEALEKMEKSGVAKVVLEQHMENKELTPDCFLQAAVHGVHLN